MKNKTIASLLVSLIVTRLVPLMTEKALQAIYFVLAQM